MKLFLNNILQIYILNGFLFNSFIAFKDCLQPNYITRKGQIYAVDPTNPTNERLIKIKGISWKGMESRNGVPDGLWGKNIIVNGKKSTSVRDIRQFLSDNKFNSLRLVLNVDHIVNNIVPRLDIVHGYENREITESESYLQLISSISQAMQDEHITVLLDLHLLTYYFQDPLWYTKKYVEIKKTPIYKALGLLTKYMCNKDHWNIIGVDLKNEPFDGRWEDNEGEIKTNWRLAAQQLGNFVNENCPQWLVVVQGAGSSLEQDKYNISTSFKIETTDWMGGNFRNASKYPITLTQANKLVYAPHVYTHGIEPKPYFYQDNYDCGFKSRANKSRCIDFDNGVALSKHVYSCSGSKFVCKSYQHASKSDIKKNYGSILKQAFGYLTKEKDNEIPIILGSFGGVYGKHQPQQSMALEYLIDYSIKHTQGGYFWALNPDTEYFLEDVYYPDEEKYPGKKGVFPQTHYGMMNIKDWTQPHQDLLKELNKMASSEIPCFGEGQTSNAMILELSFIVYIIQFFISFYMFF